MGDVRATKKQKELLGFVDGFIKGHGYGPSYREIMRSLGYKSVSTVATHIDGLISKGYLIKRDNSARSLEVLNSQYKEATTSVGASSSNEKWLMGIINDKFKELEKSHEEKILDQLFVLMATLKVVGLIDAHTAVKARITDYTNEHKG
jgi:SOS-response transcriptional repressor LexA